MPRASGTIQTGPTIGGFSYRSLGGGICFGRLFISSAVCFAVCPEPNSFVYWSIHPPLWVCSEPSASRLVILFLLGLIWANNTKQNAAT